MTDLDARVAALMHIIDSNVSNLEFAEFEQLEQAIRAELQKPALHQPIPDGLIEVLRGGRQCDEDGSEIIMSRQACCEAADILESFLQGRAKPAQEEITDAAFAAAVQHCEIHGIVEITPESLEDIVNVVVRASKGEKL